MKNPATDARATTLSQREALTSMMASDIAFDVDVGVLESMLLAAGSGSEEVQAFRDEMEGVRAARAYAHGAAFDEKGDIGLTGEERCDSK
jgi:hypothetical protein